MSLRNFTSLATASLVALSILSASCSSETKGTSSGTSGTTSGDPPAVAKPDGPKLFAKSVTSVNVEIDYGVDAAPYDGDLKKFGSVWNLFRSNANAIFDGKKTVTFPDAVSAMEKLDDVVAKNYSAQDILAVATAHRGNATTADTAAFYIVFVNGFFVDAAGAEQADVLGVSIGSTGVIGMFKPAINAVQGAAPQLVEQLALVHYFGHAVGFVDNGVTVGDNNKQHVDASGHHCTNDRCAMNAAVETGAGAGAYAGSLIRSPEAVLIGQDCLSDARILESSLLDK